MLRLLVHEMLYFGLVGLTQKTKDFIKSKGLYLDKSDLAEAVLDENVTNKLK